MTTDGLRIILIMPVYNCEKQLPRVLAAIDENLLRRFWKVILIDNKSLDKSFEVATQLSQAKRSKKIQILQNDKNIGLGGTHKIAFQIAYQEQAHYLAILHGDDQARAQELHGFLDLIEKRSDLDAVLGSRFMWKSHLQGYSKVRILGNITLNILYTVLTGKVTKDLGSGLNIFKTFNYNECQKFTNGFTFNMELLLYYYERNAKVLFIPISWFETDQVSNVKTFSVGWKALVTLLRWRFARKSN